MRRGATGGEVRSPHSRENDKHFTRALRAEGRKVHKVMHEFKEGTLHSGSKKGPEVTNRKQALAIALSEQRKVKSNALKAKR